MSTDTSPSTGVTPESEPMLVNVVSDQGRLLMAIGAVVAVLGLLAVLFPIFSSMTIAIFYGGALLLAGFAHIAHAFSAPGWKGAVGEVALAAVFGIAGFLLLINPILTLAALTLLLIGYFVAEALVLLYMAWTLRAERNWLWTAVAAVVTFVVAGLLWAGFPSTAAWALGLLFGINLFVTGVAMFVVGYGAAKTTEPATRTMGQPGAGV